MFRLTLFLLVFSSSLSQVYGLKLFTYKDNQPYKDCRAAKEFITSSEFLKKEKVFPTHSDDLRGLALKITAGCRGSAQRFKDVFRTLDRAGFPRHRTIQTALDYSKRSDSQTKAFVLSFQKAYLKKYLDMTPIDAFELAQSLSSDVTDEYSASAKDFEKMVSFCIHHRAVSLPKKYCSKQALKLARFSGRYKELLFADFKDLYFWFMKNLGGANDEEVSAPQSIEWALKVVANGPQAKENFINTFNYFRGSSNFPLLPMDQVRFALQVSQLSHQSSEGHPYNSEGLQEPVRSRPPADNSPARQ